MGQHPRTFLTAIWMGTIAGSFAPLRADAAAPDLSAERGLQGEPCLAAVAARADDWQPREAWRRVADDALGAKVYRAPTGEIGVWLEAAFHRDGAARLLRITPEAVSQASFAAHDCELSSKEIQRQLDKTQMAAAFTDQTLKEFLATYPHGALIVSWSPHMPWSFEQIRYARELARERQLGLAIVMDPGADETFAHEAARQNHLGEDIFRRIESLELIYRGFTTHYPASIVTKNGQFTSAILPGREVPKALAQFADTHAEARTVQAPISTWHPMVWATALLLLLSAAFFYTYRRSKKI